MENKVEAPALKYNYILPEEYLEAERAATEKHEYYQGEIFAMSGASLKHNIIFSNIFGDIAYRLKGKGCQPFGSDLRIHIPTNTLYTYPDISIICGPPDLTDEHVDTATNPSVIIEILSGSTRNYDQIAKFSLYREIESFKAYILVDTQKIHVQRHLRNSDDTWQLTDFRSIDQLLTIETVGVTIPLNEIYAGVL